MERNLQDQFDRALAGDPGVAPDELARAAIVEGAALRRRRHRLTGVSVAAAVILAAGGATGLNVLLRAPDAADPPVTVAAAMMPEVAPSCTRQPVQSDATDAMIFLSGAVTDPQRTALDTALRADPRIGAVLYEGRQQAFERFRDLWADNPDLVDAVAPAQFPEAFRVRLTAASQYRKVRADYAAMAGVDQIAGRRCTEDAPVGGVL